MDQVVSEAAKDAPHPFYPLNAEILGYLANEYSVPYLLGTFFAGCAVIVGLTYAMIGRQSPVLSNSDKAAVLWNVLTGFIHLFFEGYFAYNHASMAGKGDLFGEMWKEYAFSDSRYITRDAFVVCMESTTAILWGPISFCVAWMITSKNPLRYPLQMVVTMGQLYGLELYYATSMFDHYINGITYFRPEAYYFWVYYFFMNFIWVVFPGILLVNSIQATAKAFATLDKQTGAKPGSGSLKKRN